MRVSGPFSENSGALGMVAIGCCGAVIAGVLGILVLAPRDLSVQSERNTDVGEFGPAPIVVAGPGVLMDQPISEPGQWEVLCPSVDAGVTVQDLLVDTAGTTHRTDTLYIGNDSSTCVRIGGRGAEAVALTSSTGFSIGTSCREGGGISMDAKGGDCKSAGAAVTVDVIGGKR